MKINKIILILFLLGIMIAPIYASGTITTFAPQSSTVSYLNFSQINPNFFTYLPVPVNYRVSLDNTLNITGINDGSYPLNPTLLTDVWTYSGTFSTTETVYNSALQIRLNDFVEDDICFCANSEYDLADTDSLANWFNDGTCGDPPELNTTVHMEGTGSIAFIADNSWCGNMEYNITNATGFNWDLNYKTITFSLYIKDQSVIDNMTYGSSIGIGAYDSNGNLGYNSISRTELNVGWNYLTSSSPFTYASSINESDIEIIRFLVNFGVPWGNTTLKNGDLLIDDVKIRADCFESNDICYIPLLGTSIGSTNLLKLDNLNIPYRKSAPLLHVTSSDSIYETSNKYYELNLFNAKDEDPIVYLNYNNTEYLMEQIVYDDGGISTYAHNLTIPLIGNTTENVTYYFTITDSEGSYNSSFYNQSVDRIYLAICNSSINTSTLNFTIKDEADDYNINGDVDSEWNFYDSTGDGSIYRSYFVGEDNQNIHDYCIHPADLDLIVDAEIFYEETGYYKRSYYLNDANLNNDSYNIDLFLVNSTDALEHQISLLDEYGSSISGGYIQIQRYYRDTGTTKTVEILKTDSSGRDLAHFLMNGEEYSMIASYNGLVVHTGDPFKPYCPQSAVGDPCYREIRLGYDASQLLYDAHVGFTDNLYYNNDTEKFIYTWADTTGASHTGRLYVFKRGITDITICDTSSSGSAGTITCDVSADNSEGEIYAYAYNTHSLESVEHVISEIFDDYYEVFGNDGIFWGFLLIIVLTFIGLATGSITNSTMMFLISLWVVKFMGLIYLPTFALLGLTATIIVVIWGVKS